MYADETQLYICFNTQDTACAIANLKNCMKEIEKWMEKTDFVITGSTSLLKKLNISTINVGDSAVSTRCKKLCVIFDSHLSIEQQVTTLCKSCGHQIHMIGRSANF